MTTNRNTDVASVEHISQIIHVVRGHRVILDKDLATIYGVETRALNQAVKRNAERFPQDFRFALTAEESMALRSQNVTSKGGSGRHRKYSIYAFTEHGAIQAANVVNSDRAIAMSIYVVRAFVQLRGFAASSSELALRELTNVPPSPPIRPIGPQGK